MGVLDEIVKKKREDLKIVRSRVSLSELKTRLGDIEAPIPFKETLKRRQNEPVRLIAELKKSSPSEGRIREDFDVPEIISVYDTRDVRAISVLTEERYFEGSLDYLSRARQLTDKPLLRKDFIFDDYQVYESRTHCADAILLIAAILSRSQIEDLSGLSNELSLECLVEVHNLKELDTVLTAGVDIIGINNRDLNTFRTSLSTTLELTKDIPEGKTIVSESGIHTRKDVELIESGRVDAILVGTTIMRAEDIGGKIDELLGK
jgi:indole-3-glycerol phosphate synthase